MVSTSVLPANPGSKPKKLLEQTRDVLRLKHYSLRTERSYCDWIKRFIHFHQLRHPKEMGAAEISRFLTHLARVGNVSAATQNQALSALLFLYQQVRGAQNLRVFAWHAPDNGGATLWERASVDGVCRLAGKRCG